MRPLLLAVLLASCSAVGSAQPPKDSVRERDMGRVNWMEFKEVVPSRVQTVLLPTGTLEPHGSFVGSHAVVILSQADRARDAAMNVMRFFAEESCGQCTPCRVGTAKALTLLDDRLWDKELIEELSTVMADASICGLGQAAPNPMRCVMKYFPHEIE